MMLPTDMALLEEPFREYVEIYAKDQDRFFEDFKNAFLKLVELGFEKRSRMQTTFFYFIYLFKQALYIILFI